MNLSPFKKFDLVQSEDGKSMSLDFDLDTHLARLTIYDRGEDAGACDMEIVNVESEQTEFWEHQEFHNAVELYAILSDFRGRLEFLAGRQKSPAASEASSRSFELFLQGKRIGLDGILEPLLPAGA